MRVAKGRARRRSGDYDHTRLFCLAHDTNDMRALKKLFAAALPRVSARTWYRGHRYDCAAMPNCIRGYIECAKKTNTVAQAVADGARPILIGLLTQVDTARIAPIPFS